MEDVLVFIGMFAMLFGIVYIKSRENMALIERGINPRLYATRIRIGKFNSLKYGFLLVFAGIGLLLAYYLDYRFDLSEVKRRISHISEDGVAHYYAQSSDVAAVYFALTGIGGGLGLIFSYMIQRKERTGIPEEHAEKNAKDLSE